MNTQRWASAPGIFDNGGVAHIGDLFYYVEFTKLVEFLVAANLLQFVGVEAFNVSDVSEPVVDEAVFFVFLRGFNAATA